jgi:hypothetical protein
MAQFGDLLPSSAAIDRGGLRSRPEDNVVRQTLLATLSLLALASPLHAQSPSDLRQRYGAPVGESYLVRPGIVATVTYTADGRACEVEIDPVHRRGAAGAPGAGMAPEVVDELIEELAPGWARGALQQAWDAEAGRRGGRGGEYEHAYVIALTQDEGRGITHVTITWKDAPCAGR